MRPIKPLAVLALGLSLFTAAITSGQPARPSGKPPAIEEKTASMHKLPGFLPVYWDETEGKLYLEVPAFGVEMVKPVAKNETREADQFMEDLFLSAGLPLVHVISSENYSEKDLTELFQLAILKVKQTKTLRASGRSDSIPHCPVCGKMMVLRMHRTGPDKGKMYYGCMDNPRCNGSVEIARS